MATSESTCSNKRTLSENVNVMIGRGDDISHDPEEPELTNANVNDEERSETITKSAENFDEGTRSRKLTDKGNEEKIRRLKQKRTTALSAVTRKRTDITKLMTDTNNLDVVKTELTQLDILCEQFEYTHNLYLEELDSPEDKETASCHYADKENDIFEYRKQVANWITSCKCNVNVKCKCKFNVKHGECLRNHVSQRLVIKCLTIPDRIGILKNILAII